MTIRATAREGRVEGEFFMRRGVSVVSWAVVVLLTCVFATLLVPAAPVLAAAPAAADTLRGEDDGPARVLRRPAQGASAVRRLGDDLGRVARFNDMSTRGLERLLRRDPAAGVLPTGRVYYAEPLPGRTTAEPAAAAPFPYDQTFDLHSNPGSAKTIYLDFDGFDPAGTVWVDGAYFPLGRQPAFSLDGTAEFDVSERDLIQSVWQRVSEDYAPFDVDVTTADPGPAALTRSSRSDTVFGTRVVITPTREAPDKLCSGNCGGVATMGTFDTVGSGYHQPAWVFAQALAFHTKPIAEAVSHEVGHNLGLEHDGRRSRDYIAGYEYWHGQGAWAPIMGSAVDRPVSQWSSGEYAVANNREDDLQVITRNGLGRLRDDHGDTISGATPVPSDERSTGVVGTRADRDVFRFKERCAGPVTVSVAPNTPSPNLDVRLRLFRADGTRIASADPVARAASADTATGLAASTTTTVRTGQVYFAEVDGVGSKDPATTGYSDYASLGGYTISSTGCSPAALEFLQAEDTVFEHVGPAQLVVTRTGNTAIPASVQYEVTGGDAEPGDDFSLEPATLSFASGETRKSITVQLLRDPMPEPDETVVVTLSSPGPRAGLGERTTLTLTIEDDDGPAEISFVDSRPVLETTDVVDLTVTRRWNTGIPASVSFAAEGGTATQGSDFLLDPGTVDFAPGETSKSVSVRILDDDVAEADETVRVVLRSRSPATTISQGTVLVTIIDDQEKAAVGFEDTVVDAQEDTGTVELTVSRAGRTDIASTVSYERWGGWDSVSVENGTLHFAPGEVRKTIVVGVDDDEDPEGESTIWFELSRPSAGTSLTTSTATLTILSSDQQPDAFVSRRQRVGYVGKGIHDADATGQTVALRAGRGGVRTAYVKVWTLGNYGAVDHPARLAATPSQPGSRVRYFIGARDVTELITSPDGLPFQLGAGVTMVRVEITIGDRTAIGATKSAVLSATWTGDRVLTDVVGVAVRVTG